MPEGQPNIRAGVCQDCGRRVYVFREDIDSPHVCSELDLFNRANLAERQDGALRFIRDGSRGDGPGRDPAGDLLRWQTTSPRDLAFRAYEEGYLDGVYWAVKFPTFAALWATVRDHWTHTTIQDWCAPCQRYGPVKEPSDV